MTTLVPVGICVCGTGTVVALGPFGFTIHNYAKKDYIFEGLKDKNKRNEEWFGL